MVLVRYISSTYRIEVQKEVSHLHLLWRNAIGYVGRKYVTICNSDSTVELPYFDSCLLESAPPPKIFLISPVLALYINVWICKLFVQMFLASVNHLFPAFC